MKRYVPFLQRLRFVKNNRNAYIIDDDMEKFIIFIKLAKTLLTNLYLNDYT
jgi:hypothetical protein